MGVTKAFVFALTPPDRAFDDAYELGIKDACKEVDAYCERVERQDPPAITDRTHNLISKADVVVAEMSTRNPEVFYQTGYAHALGKPVILLTRAADDIPFDLNQYAHVVYENSISRLKEELTKRLRWAMENPERNPADAEFALHLYIDGERLTSDASSRIETKAPMKQITTGGGDGIVVDLDLHNPTDRPVSRNVSIALVTGDLEKNLSGANVVALPDSRFMHVFQRHVAILPDCWDSVQWKLHNPLTLFSWGTQFDIDVVIYTELERVEYLLRVECVRP